MTFESYFFKSLIMFKNTVCRTAQLGTLTIQFASDWGFNTSGSNFYISQLDGWPDLLFNDFGRLCMQFVGRRSILGIKTSSNLGIGEIWRLYD